MKTIIKLLVIVALGVTMTSCSSGWSCKKRYVKSEVPSKNTKNVLDQKNNINS